MTADVLKAPARTSGVRATRFALAYAGLSVIAAAYAGYRGNFARANSEFSGLPLIMLGLPWSFLFGRAKPDVGLSAFNTSVVFMSAAAAVNVALLYVVGRLIDRRRGLE